MNLVRFLRVSKKSRKGFTLIEILVILSILGILGTLTAPAFTDFLQNYQLSTAQNQLYQGIRQAQSKAMQTKTAWRFGIREDASYLEWAVYPDGVTPLHWQRLDKSLRLDDETTLRRSAQGVYSAKFDHRGNARILGRVTLTSEYSSNSQRCVIISTLLGTVRQGRGHSKPDSSGKHCY